MTSIRIKINGVAFPPDACNDMNIQKLSARLGPEAAREAWSSSDAPRAHSSVYQACVIRRQQRR
jgi:hypothetical protein